MINVVLYEPEIPANTGNIMRICTAFGCSLHLIEPLGFYLDETHLKRAGMDYIDDLDYHVYHDWDAFLSLNRGWFAYVTRYGYKTPSEFDFSVHQNEDIYLVFGKESTGIPKEILRNNLDQCMRIPMRESARSLNLSNCVALVVYEALDQLGFPGLSRTESLKGNNFLIR